MTTSVPRPTALLVCCLLGACQQPSPRASERDGDQPSTPAPPPAPAPEPPPPTIARVHASVDGVGLHVLDEQGWRLLLDTRSPIRDMLVIDGQLLILSAFGVQRVDAEGRAETIAPFSRDDFTRLGDPLALASDGDRDLWVAGTVGVARHTSSWQLTPVDATDFTAPDLALDRAGRPYLVLGSKLHHHQQDRWQPLAIEPPIEPLALAPDPRSEAVLVHAGCQPDRGACLLLRVSGEEVTSRIELPIDECPDYGRMAVSPDGGQVAIAGRCGLVRQSFDDEAKPLQLGLDDGWPGQPLRSIALDTSGRVWAATNNGLLIVAADGSVQEYPLGQLGEITGSVGSILVEGQGPPTPTLGNVRTGGLAGTLVVLDGGDKRPLPGVRLELCNRLPPGGELEPDPARSPCAGVESVHATTTDAEGRFEFSRLPIDHYYFGVEIDGRWVRARPKVLNMRAGMNGNVGKVVVEPPTESSG